MKSNINVEGSAMVTAMVLPFFMEVLKMTQRQLRKLAMAMEELQTQILLEKIAQLPTMGQLLNQFKGYVAGARNRLIQTTQAHPLRMLGLTGLGAGAVGYMLGRRRQEGGAASSS